MDESACCSAADSSGNNHTGTYASSGVTYDVTGAITNDSDTGISINGSAAAVSYSSSLLSSGASARTMEVWFKTTGNAQALADYGPGNNRFALFEYSGQLEIYTDQHGSVTLSTPYGIADNNWHLADVTYDGGTTAIIYLDGQQIGSGSFSGSLTSGPPLVLASDNTAWDNFTGSLDEFALYGTALSASEINKHWQVGSNITCTTGAGGYPGAVVADSPSSYYRLADSGAALSDSSGNCHVAAYRPGISHVVGGVVSTADGGTTVPGGNGLNFAMSTDYFSITTSHTYEIWFNTSNSSQALFGYGPCNNRMSLFQYSNQLTLYTDTSGSVGASTGTTSDGIWHQAVVTYDASSHAVVLYLDGASVGSGTLSSAISSPSGYLFTTGTDCNPYNVYTGSLAEFSVYPSVLSATRVQAHFNGGAPVGGPLTAAQAAGGGDNYCIPCHGAQIRHYNVTDYPIDTASGNFWHSFTDLSIPGRSYPLEIDRTYNSSSAGTNGPLGYGWQLNYGATLSVGGSTATITQENGSQVTFTQSGSTWSPSEPRFIATLTHNADGSWTFVRNARDTYTFNSSGQLTGETDLNAYTTSFSYTSGNLTAITDPAGRSLTLGWTGAHITSVTDANVTPSRSATYQYNDGGGNLTDVIDVAGNHWQFTYDANHRMTVMKDPRCYNTTGCPGIQNTYDTSGRVTSQKDQLNRQTTFDYASIANATKTTDPKGNVSVDYYNGGVRVASTKGYGTAQAATWRYAYDASTLALIQTTDPNQHTTAYTVDASGNVLTTTDALTRQTVKTYNSLNEVLTTKDPNGVTTTNQYDSHGNLTSSSRPLTGTNQTQTVTYNHADSSHPGDVTSMVDGDNKTWTYGYDSYGDRSSTTDPLGNQATSTFNADGWLVSSVSPKGNVSGCGCQSSYTTTYGHDAYGNLTSATDPLSHTSTKHYDADQNVDWSQDADGNKTTYAYDQANERTQVQRPDSTTLTTDYNTDGTVADQKDGKNNAILSYTYDPLARISTQTDALSNATTFTYDGAGNQLTKQDRGGNCSASPKTGCTSYAYNGANELTAISYSDGVTPNVASITYDGDGQRTGMSDGTGTSSWTWDSLHRLTSYANGHGDKLQYAYNLRNLLTTLTYPGGSQSVTRAYDDAGRWTSVSDWNSNTTSFGYDPNSNLTAETLPSGTGVVDTFTFDNSNNLTGISDAKGATSLFSATYARDSANQLTSDSSAPSTQTAFQYTQLNQLCYAGSSSSTACSSPPSGAQVFSFDAADNPTQLGASYQAFNAADEICWSSTTSGSACGSPPTGATPYSFDARGNRTASGSTTLTYDQANRLTAYGSAGSYAYNGDGLRMSKTVSGTTTYQDWDTSASLPLVIKDGSTSYVTGPAGLPLEQIAGSTVLYLHHDQIGSTRLVTDSSGSSQATYQFDPWGNLVSSSGSVADPFRFAGQYLDAESGLYYLRARYYDASTALFLTKDPLLSKTLSPYTYASGAPINTVDPTGQVVIGEDTATTSATPSSTPSPCSPDAPGSAPSSSGSGLPDVEGGFLRTVFGVEDIGVGLTAVAGGLVLAAASAYLVPETLGFSAVGIPLGLGLSFGGGVLTAVGVKELFG